MRTITLFDKTGSFAEDKDLARNIRVAQLIPALEKGESIVLNFEGVDSATQSFIHALISDLMRKYGNDVLDRIQFKSCSETVQKIIAIVVDYMQES
ncbi:MAG: STAS-like domain-containing protein [Parcubacteria group bacterium]|nr:STAS-like domain-containing protein [Parcubacteria group bacterium]